MREIDLLLREFSNTILSSLDECSIHTFDQVLDYDDQKLFDYIFKNDLKDLENYFNNLKTLKEYQSHNTECIKINFK